jgi:hypothetical protein
MNLRKFFLYTLIISVVISALIGIGVLLFGDFGEVALRVLMTTFTITLGSILGLACGVYIEAGRGRMMPIAGIGFSILAAILCIILIWFSDIYSNTYGKFAVTFPMLATALALLCLVSLARLDGRFMWSRYVIHAAVWILNAILLYILWFEPESSSDMVARMIGILSIIVAALTIMTPVFHKLSRKVVATEALDIKIARLRAEIEELERQKEAIGTSAI